MTRPAATSSSAPLIASAGGTEHEALEELRDAAHFGVDTMIDMKIEDIKR